MTATDSLKSVSDLVKNVKAIHQDLIRGDFARLEVVDLRGRLQTCQVENNSLEVTLQNSQRREKDLNAQVDTANAETSRVKTENKKLVRSGWILGGAAIVSTVLYITSLLR